MGAWWVVRAATGVAALCLATRAGASTVVEPIARLSLESGFDTNPLYDGVSSDRLDQISPEVGVRIRDPLWDTRLGYRADWLRYRDLAPDGIWNHHGAFSLDARPVPRLELNAWLRGFWAYDPIGLAQAGVFHSGQQSAFFLDGRGRAEYQWTRRVDAAATFVERTVIFDDRTGGAMHAPGVEALRRLTRRLSLGVAGALGVYQSFDPDGTHVTFSEGVRARARWRAARSHTVEASAGPALWHGPGGGTIVPEASLDVFGGSRAWAYRFGVAHGLGIGTTARPGLVDSLEAAGDRRFKRRFWVHAEGGVWRSGLPPTGAFAATGFAIGGEAGVLVGKSVRLSLGAARFGRVDDPSPQYRRTIVGLRLGWELRAAREVEWNGPTRYTTSSPH